MMSRSRSYWVDCHQRDHLLQDHLLRQDHPLQQADHGHPQIALSNAGKSVVQHVSSKPVNPAHTELPSLRSSRSPPIPTPRLKSSSQMNESLEAMKDELTSPSSNSLNMKVTYQSDPKIMKYVIHNLRSGQDQ